jgi:hypothetical protein
MPRVTATPRIPQESLEDTLRPIHRAWLEEARCLLEPALDAGADFWTRWAAIRYLSDDFREQFRLEHGLVNELCPFLPAEASERLLRGGDRILHLRLELERLQRRGRRVVTSELAIATRDLLEQLGVWCGEIEAAAEDVRPDELRADAALLIDQLRDGLEACA